MTKQPKFKEFPSDTFLKGAECALINSFELFNDGILLFNNNRLCRAYTLFQFSIEEAGKVIFLLDIYTAVKIHENYPEQIDNKVIELYDKLHKRFYSHRQKTEYIIKYELQKNDFGKSVDTIKQNSEIDFEKIVERLDIMKNESLYTFIDVDKFILPSEKFDLSTIIKIKDNAFSKLTCTKNNAIKFLKNRQTLIDIDVAKLDVLRLDHAN